MAKTSLDFFFLPSITSCCCYSILASSSLLTTTLPCHCHFYCDHSTPTSLRLFWCHNSLLIWWCFNAITPNVDTLFQHHCSLLLLLPLLILLYHLLLLKSWRSWNICDIFGFLDNCFSLCFSFSDVQVLLLCLLVDL